MSDNAIIPKDAIRESLYFALIHSFRAEGYADSECAKLASIAVGPVHSALQQANYAYKLYVEAISDLIPMWLRQPAAPTPEKEREKP